MNNAIEDNCEVNNEYNEIQITQKKKRKITKNQEEMSNLLGNIRNANKNNNGM